MFFRVVKVGMREIVVMCTTQTPLSEVLQMASKEMHREEQVARDSDPITMSYRSALAQSEDASRKRGE